MHRRCRGRLCEIREADLRFDDTEAVAFTRAMDLELSATEVDILQRRTEGWVELSFTITTTVGANTLFGYSADVIKGGVATGGTKGAGAGFINVKIGG